MEWWAAVASRRDPETWNSLEPRSLYRESVADTGVTQFQPPLAASLLAGGEMGCLCFVSQLLVIYGHVMQFEP